MTRYGGPEMQAYIARREMLGRLAERVAKELEKGPSLIAETLSLSDAEKIRLFNQALDKTTHWTVEDLLMRLD